MGLFSSEIAYILDYQKAFLGLLILICSGFGRFFELCGRFAQASCKTCTNRLCENFNFNFHKYLDLKIFSF